VRVNRLNPRLLIPVGAGVLVVLLWFVVLWGPQGSALSKAKKRAATAEQQEATLQDQLTRLQASKRDAPLKQSQLETLRVAVPDDPNLAQFILDANDAASKSGIDFLSITPTPPSTVSSPSSATAGAAAGTPQPVPIKLAMSISGGYFQVIDFLNLLDKLPRIVVIDSLSISGGGSTGQLSVTLQARMFISAAKPVAGSAGAAGAAGASGATTTTTTTAGATTTTAVSAR
jgi:Tfp pilus assembly protein PilO